MLRAKRDAHQGEPLGHLLNAAALWLVLRRLSAENPTLLVRAYHDDIVLVGAAPALRRLLADAARLGVAIDADLAPAKCVAWSPSGGSAPPGWAAPWVTEAVQQFSALLGTPNSVSAAVRALVAEQRRLTEVIAALPPSALQTQLLLLRLCAGPRANYWLLALPLEAGAELASAVDRDAGDVLARLLCDARDPASVRSALLARAALPPAMGGLGIGCRTRVAAPAALASWTDALRAGVSYSPALRDGGTWLRASSAASAGWVADAPPSPAPLFSPALAGGSGVARPPDPAGAHSLVPRGGGGGGGPPAAARAAAAARPRVSGGDPSSSWAPVAAHAAAGGGSSTDWS